MQARKKTLPSGASCDFSGRCPLSAPPQPGQPRSSKRSLLRASETKSDTADRPGLEGGSRSLMHALLLRSPRECGAPPNRVAYGAVVHKLERLVRPIAILALAVPNRRRFPSPQKRNRRMLNAEFLSHNAITTFVSIAVVIVPSSRASILQCFFYRREFRSYQCRGILKTRFCS